MRHATCAVAVLVTVLGCAMSAAAAGPYDRYVAPESVCPNAGVAAPASVAQEATMLCVIGYARGAAGLGKVAPSPLLAASAGTKADDIVRCDEFSHTACGTAWNASLVSSGYLAPGAAADGDEILGAGTGEGTSPRSILRAWLEQDEHRAVLLGAAWREVGVAVRTPPVASGQANGAIWVGHFGWRASPATARPTSTKAASPGAITTGSGEVDAKLTQLRLTALTARVRSGPWVRVRFVLTAASAGARRAVSGMTVFFAARRARTDAKGRASFFLRLRRSGSYQAVVSTGSRRATATVFARR